MLNINKVDILLIKEDDLELELETTWVEENNHFDFTRVIVVKFWTSDIVKSDSESLAKTVGDPLRQRITMKLKNDIGLEHPNDYIFTVYDNPTMKNGKWLSTPLISEHRVVLRMRHEEHFAMFKMHYTP